MFVPVNTTGTLFIFKDLFMCGHCCSLQRHQKRALSRIADGREPPCGCWGLKLALYKSNNCSNH